MTVIPEGYEPLDWTLSPDRGFGGLVGPIYQRAQGAHYARAFRVEPRHANGVGSCHGGMLMAFADAAFGHAVSVRVPHFWVTIRLTIDFLSGARVGDWVEGTGTILGEAGDLYTVQGRVWCGARTILTGSGVFKTIDSTA